MFRQNNPEKLYTHGDIPPPFKRGKVRLLSDTDTLSTINQIITHNSRYCSDHSPPTLQFKLNLNKYIRLREKNQLQGWKTIKIF